MPALQEIFHQLATIWLPHRGLYITDIHRRPSETIPGESGVHNAGPPFRAIDIRIRNLNKDPEKAQAHADSFADILNNTWVYDPKRPHLCVAVAKLHGTGSHIHLQVHTRTRRKSHGI
jgi:hypothetical protein